MPKTLFHFPFQPLPGIASSASNVFTTSTKPSNNPIILSKPLYAARSGPIIPAGHNNGLMTVSAYDDRMSVTPTSSSRPLSEDSSSFWGDEGFRSKANGGSTSTSEVDSVVRRRGAGNKQPQVRMNWYKGNHQATGFLRSQHHQ